MCARSQMCAHSTLHVLLASAAGAPPSWCSCLSSAPASLPRVFALPNLPTSLSLLPCPSPQVVELDFQYPSEGIHKRWDGGYRITAMAATPDQVRRLLPYLLVQR